MRTFTEDSIFDGNILIRQERSGYRFSIDAVLLAAHVRPKPGTTVLDLGTGCGIISLILAYRNRDLHVIGVDVQKTMADIALHNVKKNRMSERVRIFYKDMKTLPTDDIPAPVERVISNPPFRKSQSGRVNPDDRRAIARHELKVSLTDILSVSRRMLKTAGKFSMIYPAERMTDLFFEMRKTGIEPKRIRHVHAKIKSDAKLVIVEGVKGANSGVTASAPLMIYRGDGSYSDEVKAMLSP